MGEGEMSLKKKNKKKMKFVKEREVLSEKEGFQLKNQVKMRRKEGGFEGLVMEGLERKRER